MIQKLIILNLIVCLTLGLGLRSNQNLNAQGNTIKSMAYISEIQSWTGEEVINNIGVNSCYDILILTFWLSESGPADVVKLYHNIHSYIGSDAYGKSNEEVHKTISDMLKAKGKQLFISAFGDTDYPTSQDPDQVAERLASWVNSHPYIDGVDLDYEDSAGIENGQGVEWLIQFTKSLRQKFTNKNIILTHAPQAPYFSVGSYPSGAYYKIDNEVGHLIDWYNVQFYNQNENAYDTYQTIFVQSGKWYYQTSYSEIIKYTNVPLNKIVLGKPAVPHDANNTGYVDPYKLGQYTRQAEDQLNLTIPGFFIWQLVHDSDCSFHDSFYKGYSQTSSY